MNKYHRVLKVGGIEGKISRRRVIFGHGLGDTPHGWAEVCGRWQKSLPEDVQFILPASPIQKVTMNFGMKMPAW